MSCLYSGGCRPRLAVEKQEMSGNRKVIELQNIPKCEDISLTSDMSDIIGALCIVFLISQTMYNTLHKYENKHFKFRFVLIILLISD